jgi:hypothetical protein
LYLFFFIYSLLLFSQSGAVYAVAFDTTHKALYVGGFFQTVGTLTAASNIAKYDIATSTWSALGAGTDSQVSAVHNRLFVGGQFTSADSVAQKYLAVWDTGASGWDLYLLPSMIDNYVNALAIDTGRNKLYVGGRFGTINSGATTVNYVAQVDVTTGTWRGLGTSTKGVNGDVNALAFDSANNRLYVGGVFECRWISGRLRCSM